MFNNKKKKQTANRFQKSPLFSHCLLREREKTLRRWISTTPIGPHPLKCSLLSWTRMSLLQALHCWSHNTSRYPPCRSSNLGISSPFRCSGGGAFTQCGGREQDEGTPQGRGRGRERVQFTVLEGCQSAV